MKPQWNSRWIHVLQTFILWMTWVVLLSGVSSASEMTATLEPITVTAERFPVQESESSRMVTVIEADQLQETGANNLLDALRRSGGFAYKAFGPLGISHGGMNSTLSIRGIKDGELILINGVPIQGAAGHAYDLNTLPIEQIERVEILKGAASTLYGADAMSGVINIITKKPLDTKAFKASVEFGNEGYENHTAGAFLPGINLGVNYQHLGSQTEISRSDTQKYRYDLDPTDRYAVNMNARPFERLYVDYLGSVTETGFKKIYDTGKPYEGTDQAQTKHFADLRYEATDFKSTLFGTYDIMRRTVYTAKSPDDANKNYNTGIEADGRFGVSGWRFASGASAIYRGADYSNQYGEHHRTDYAFFMEAKRTFFERWTLSLGGREQYIDGESGTADDDRFLPAIGLSWLCSPGLHVFANAAKAFRAPTFNQLYYSSSFLVGNPDLKPESGWTYETGAKYDTEWLRIRSALFYMTYTDKIEIDRSKGYPQTYFNAGDYQSKGIEWEIGLSPFLHRKEWIRDIYLYTAGYWADPTAEDTAGVTYQAGPKFQNSVGATYATEPFLLDINCQMLSSRERNLDSYGAWNVYGKVQAGKGFVTFGIDNVFDAEVQISGDLSDTASNRYVYWDTGRLFKVGYEITF